MDHPTFRLLLILIPLTAALDCPTGRGCQPCQNKSADLYEIICETPAAGSRFHVNFGAEWLEVKCQNSPNWVDFHLGTTRRIDSVTNLTFTDCVFPDVETFRAAVLQLSRNPVKHLCLQSGQNPQRLTARTIQFSSCLNLTTSGLNNLTHLTQMTMKTVPKQQTSSPASGPVGGWVIGTCVGIPLVLIAVGLMLCYRYQNEIKAWLKKFWGSSKDEKDDDDDDDLEKLYDAFISYSHKDVEFVMNDMMTVLEGGSYPLKLCVHFRDWKAGEWVPTQIANSVENSRRTIVVLSPNFLESDWGKMELRTAHHQAISEGKKRVVIVIFGDIGPLEQLEPEIQTYLAMNTCVKWGDPWFWDKLMGALPHRWSLTEQ